VSGFKGAVTRRVRAIGRLRDRPLWQRGYYEHVVRDEAELHHIRQYVEDNPRSWGDDIENPLVWRPRRRE
jgi:REP element-mobilizing transposase RayT